MSSWGAPRGYKPRTEATCPLLTEQVPGLRAHTCPPFSLGSLSPHPIHLEIPPQHIFLVGIHAITAGQKLWEEGYKEAIKVHRGHVVNGDANLLLQKVVGLVNQDLEQHIHKLKQHGGPEDLLQTERDQDE